MKGIDQHDPTDLDVTVKVGWVKGLNQLYFLYEATDNYWDFFHDDLHNDIFEVVIDADRSGALHSADASRRDVAREAGDSLSVSRRPCPELSHLHTCGREGLVHGLGRAAVD